MIEQGSLGAVNSRCVRLTVAGSICLFATIVSQTPGVAASVDSRLIGAWAASASDCPKIFQQSGGAVSYRQPVDKFAQAFIIDGENIRSPTGACRILKISQDKDGTALALDCHDSISYLSQTVHVKIRGNGEIIYSPTGDPSLDTTYLKCP